MKEQPRVETLLRLGMLITLSTVGACAAGPHSTNAEDGAITARVQAVLQESVPLQAPNLVTVQTVKHVVYLRGLVGTPYQRELANSLATQASEGLLVVNMVAVENNR